MQCTGLSQWEVIPRIVDTQHRLVVGGNASLWRRALVQGAVLSFAEGQEHMLKVSEKTPKYSKNRPNAQPRAPTGKSNPKEIFVCAFYFGAYTQKLPAAHWRKNAVVLNGSFNCMVQKSVMFLIISFSLSCCPLGIFFVYRELFSSPNHFSSLNPAEYFKDDAA